MKRYLLSGLVVSLLATTAIISCQKRNLVLQIGSSPGVAAAGRINAGTVCAYSLTETGAQGGQLACTTSDATGNFTLPLGTQVSPFEIVVTGGTYAEEANGATVTVGTNQLRVFLTDTVTIAAPWAVTPLTEIAASCVEASGSTTFVTLDTAIANCNVDVATAAGLNTILTPPVDPLIPVTDVTADAAKYALFLAGMSQAAINLGMPNSFALTTALALDFHKDKTFNGSDNGTPVTIQGVGLLPTNMWTLKVPQGMSEFGSSSGGVSHGFSAMTPPSVAGGTFVPICAVPTSLCGASCVNLATNPAHCGTCATACAPQNATASCTSGACGYSVCSSPIYASCDGNAANGCESNTSTDTQNCGACGHACTVANGNPACTSSTCAVASCNAGFGNCNNDATDGCETNVTTDVNNCGSCGMVCRPTLNAATMQCSSSACKVATCNAGYGDCDNLSANGCETSTSNDNHNCGACGNVCNVGETCSAGICAAKGNLSRKR